MTAGRYGRGWNQGRRYNVLIQGIFEVSISPSMEHIYSMIIASSIVQILDTHMYMLYIMFYQKFLWEFC